MSHPTPLRREEPQPHPLDETANKWWEDVRSKRTMRSKYRGYTITEIYRVVVLNETIQIGD